MLGLAPIASLPLTSAQALTTVTANAAASIALVFSSTPLVGAFTPLTASVQFAFSATPAIYTEQLLSSSIALRFASDADLSVAGRPFQVFALPQNYTTRAILADYTAKAVPRSYTVRAKR